MSSVLQEEAQRLENGLLETDPREVIPKGGFAARQ